MAELDLIDKRRWYDRLLQEPERLFVALLFFLTSVGWFLNPDRAGDYGRPEGFPYLTATVRALYILGSTLVTAGLIRPRRNIEGAGQALLLAGTATSLAATIVIPPARAAGPVIVTGALLLLAAVMFAARLLSLTRPLKAELRPSTSGSIVLRVDDDR